MAGSVIDSLLVKLGLDSSDFKKGQQQAQKSLKDTREDVRKSSAEMSASLKEVGRQFAAVILGFEGARGLVDMLANLNQSTRQLGLFSQNIGINAADLRNWGNAVEMVGGKSSSLLDTLQMLQRENAMQHLTGNSSLLGPLRALGASDILMRQNVQMRDLLELSAAFQQMMKLPGGRPQANSLGLQMGINQDTMNLLLRGPAAIQALLDQQRQLHQLTPDEVEQTEKLAEAWTHLRQESVSLAQVLLSNLSPQLTGVFNAMSALLGGSSKTGGAVNIMSVAFDSLNTTVQETIDLFTVIKNVWKDIDGLFGGSMIGKFFSLWAKGANEESAFVAKWLHKLAQDSDLGVSPISSAVDQLANLHLSRGARNNNPGNLMAVGNQSRDAQGYRTFGTMQEGIRASNEQLDLYLKRGVPNTISGLIPAYEGYDYRKNDIPAYIQSVSEIMKVAADQTLGDADRARLLYAMFYHEGSAQGGDTINAALGTQQNMPIIRTPTWSSGALDSLRARQGVGATPSVNTSTATTSKSLNVQVDRVTVNTQATDARGIASDFADALKFKFLASQADYGLVP